MPNRLLKDSICTSESVDKLTWLEEVFFYRLIVNCDDYGRMDARPAILKSRLFPLKAITDKQIGDVLNKLSMVGIVTVYLHDGKPYLQLATWGKHQQIRAKRSKYPEPDITCNQLIADDSKCTRNPIQSNPIQSESNTESSEPLVSEESLRLSNLLRELMLTNDPAAKSPMDLKKWAIDIDKINRIDNRSFQDIEEVIKHSQQDQFWKTNILGAASLRRNFPKIYLQMKNGGNGHGINKNYNTADLAGVKPERKITWSN